MLIASFFTDNGALKAGLSPTIDIVDADTDTLIVNGAAMTALTQMTHCYVYNFAAAVAVPFYPTNRSVLLPTQTLPGSSSLIPHSSLAG